MKTISWNVQGLGNPWTFRVKSDFLCHINPQILFLCKTKCDSMMTHKLKRMLNLHGCFIVDSRGASGGLCLMWDSKVDVTIRSFSSNHIDAWIKWREFEWRFIGFYGHPNASKWWESWDLLKHLHNTDDSVLLVLGDLNEIL